MSGKLVVYIAGPMTVGDWEGNKRAAIDAAEELAAAGFVPEVPHLNAVWHLIYPHDHEFWMQLDLVKLERCDALLRLPGESSGGDRELARMKELGKPTYRSIHVLKRELGGDAVGRESIKPDGYRPATRPRGLYVLDMLEGLNKRIANLEEMEASR